MNYEYYEIDSLIQNNNEIRNILPTIDISKLGYNSDAFYNIISKIDKQKLQMLDQNISKASPSFSKEIQPEIIQIKQKKITILRDFFC